MKYTLRLLFLALFVATPVGMYYTNPFNVTSKNIRPRIFGHDLYHIPSKSMVPTLEPEDYIIISNTAYLEKPPKKNEIVIFLQASKNNRNTRIPFIKRVIAVAGDTVKIKNGVLLVNGTPTAESYIDPENKKRAYSRFQPLRTVPQNKLFVMGDNRDNSRDSRIFGFISAEDVIGQATHIIHGKNGQSWESLN